MPLSRRYSPEWAPGETNSIGMDFSGIIPPGVGITGASLYITTNSVNPQPVVASEFTSPDIDPQEPNFIIATVSGRTVYCPVLIGGVSGHDYRLTWDVNDTNGNGWARTALLLCAPTS